MRKLPIVLVASILLFAFTIPAFAGNNVVHSTVTDEFTQTFPLGAEAECFGVEPGTLVTAEITPDLKVTEFVDGPQAGRLHIRGQFTGDQTIHADGGVITGSFVNHQNVITTSDDTVFKRVVKISSTALDGSEIKVLVHVHTIVQDGDVKLEIAKFNCIK